MIENGAHKTETLFWRRSKLDRLFYKHAGFCVVLDETLIRSNDVFMYHKLHHRIQGTTVYGNFKGVTGWKFDYEAGEPRVARKTRILCPISYLVIYFVSIICHSGLVGLFLFPV